MTEIKAPEGGRPVSEMQERIARALTISMGCDPDKDSYVDEQGVEHPAWHDLLPEALAVMKAMREPTLMMCRAMPPLPAIHVVDDLPLRNAGWRMGEIQNLKRWRAAIDAEITIAEGGKDG